MNLTVLVDRVRGARPGEGGERREESLMLSENEEPATGLRAGFSGLTVYIRTRNANAGGPPTETRRGIDARPKDDKSFFRLIVLPPFRAESFDLAAYARTGRVIPARFPKLSRARARSFASWKSSEPTTNTIPPNHLRFASPINEATKIDRSVYVY